MKEPKQTRPRTPMALRMCLAAGASLSLCCSAAELTVNVTGIAAPYGSIGCSLFSTEAGFPMDNAQAKTEWIPATGDSVTCQFKDVAPGKVAVSVAHDVNGNRKVDTNLIGIPTEQWGVSNNVRPTLRAPRYDEAAFTITSDTPSLAIGIKVAK